MKLKFFTFCMCFIGYLNGNCQLGNVGINTTTANTTLTINGGFAAGYKELTSSTYTLTSTDYFITYKGFADATFTLPTTPASGASMITGRVYRIKNISEFKLTVAKAAGSTNLLITNTVGTTTVEVPQGASIEAICNGTGWDVVYSGVGLQAKSWTYKYYLDNVEEDWVEYFYTNIPADKYSMAIVGVAFTDNVANGGNGGNNLQIDARFAMNFNGRLSLGAPNVFAYPVDYGPGQPAKWVISADFDGYGTHSLNLGYNFIDYPTYPRINGRWIITVQVTNVPIGNAVSDVTFNMGGASTGAAAAPPVFQ